MSEVAKQVSRVAVQELDYWISKRQVACVAGQVTCVAEQVIGGCCVSYSGGEQVTDAAGQLMEFLDKSLDYCWLSVKGSGQDLQIVGSVTETFWTITQVAGQEESMHDK